VAELPSLPPAQKVVVNGKELAAFDLNGINSLNHFVEVAEKNKETLQGTVSLYNRAASQHNTVAEYATIQEQMSERYYADYARAVEQRNSEARWFSVERFALQLIIILSLVL